MKSFAIRLLAASLSFALAATLSACTSTGDSPSTLPHVGCDAGCAEDTTITGICARDRPHLCFCNTKGPSDECINTAVKPYAPYDVAVCCP